MPVPAKDVPTNRQAYEGHGDQTKKGRLVYTANHSCKYASDIHLHTFVAMAVKKMVGTWQCDTFEG